MIGLIAQKFEVSQVVLKNGDIVAATWLKAKPNSVVQIKSLDKDGYNAIQLGGGIKKRYNKPTKGHLKELDAKVLWEVKTNQIDKFKRGDKLDLSLFTEGDKVTITGTSKGKGFAGTIKRHNFRSGPSGHGHDHHRQPGSIGPMGIARVLPGKKMAGHMGNERTTTRGLRVVAIDTSEQKIAVKGSVPGIRHSWVLISKHE
ncbi:50S ribosomal protein L3 [Patescibacteria group bacterium]|nr:50S ribosomal protein L3 [Patescibacteria group bacterium]